MKSVPTKKNTLFGAALVAAALALPSYSPAFAEAMPTRGSASFKYLNYMDRQVGEERMNINAYTSSVMMPFAESWTVNATFTYDFLTGASPTRHNVLSSASANLIHEKRNEYDLSFTNYVEDGTWSFGSTYSIESDYIARNLSLQRSISTADKNMTITFGGNYSYDSINSYKNNVFDHKQVIGGLIGITQILTKEDIVQFNVGFSNGKGYYSDPYKYADDRPRKRNITTYMARWNHHFRETDGTSHLSYRYYTDSYDIKSHTLAAEYVQPMEDNWTITPSFRYYAQSNAFFYVPTTLGAAAYTPPNPAAPYSVDERLSAFGAFTFGIKVEKKVADDTTIDLKLEQYSQDGKWTMVGTADPGLDSFSFRSIQLGLTQLL